MSNTWELSTIRQYARDRSGFGLTQISNVDVDIIINRIYRSLMTVETPAIPLQGFSTITTVASTGEYDLDEEIINVSLPMTLDDGNGGQVADLQFFRDPVPFFELYPEDDSRDDGRPISVLLYGNANSTGSDKDDQLYVRPKPDAIYTIKFASTTRPKPLTLDTDPPTDDDMGKCIAIKTALEIINTKAGGISDRKIDLLNDLKDCEGNLNIKHIKQMTGIRSLPGF